MDAEIYKITSINEDGVSIDTYVLPAARHLFRRMMMEEYGNVEEEAMNIADVPDDIKEQINDAGIIQQ